MNRSVPLLTILFCIVASCSVPQAPEPTTGDTRQWLAGDHHVHSRFSVGWDLEQNPPAPIVGGDAIYPIPMNALMGKHHGLDWMATTDHGGPNHSKVSFDLAYPELQIARNVVPDVLYFYAMELNSPGADHASLIVPHSDQEAEQLRELEARFDHQEAYPADPLRNTGEKMLEALRHMDKLSQKPLVIAHHPSRSAAAEGGYGLYEPAEFRAWNDTAPDIAVGMEGAPGRQALALDRHGQPTRQAPRGAYGLYPTLGGFDQMTARLGGLWDSMLGEGRKWWITANSDSHIHYTEGGADFWPGEYSKTYVYAEKNYSDIMAAIRAGHMFVTTGDLISELFVTASTGAGHAQIGETLNASKDDEVSVTIRFLDPDERNHGGRNPGVRRVDLIMGDVGEPYSDPTVDTNNTARVLKRFTRGDWQREGDFTVMQISLGTLPGSVYLRVRGTNTNDLEPQEDIMLEDPWTDLWFYSNPVFIQVDPG